MTTDIAAGGGNAAIEVKGAGRLARALKKAGDDLSDLKATNKQAAQIVAQAARGTVPRRTGRLAGSIRAGATQKAGVMRAGSKRLPYAGVINYGWPKHHIKPTYFANQAAKQTEPQWSALYQQAVDRIINRIQTGDLSK